MHSWLKIMEPSIVPRPSKLGHKNGDDAQEELRCVQRGSHERGAGNIVGNVDPFGDHVQRGYKSKK